jgi:hypothetical protein
MDKYKGIIPDRNTSPLEFELEFSGVWEGSNSETRRSMSE